MSLRAISRLKLKQKVVIFGVRSIHTFSGKLLKHSKIGLRGQNNGLLVLAVSNRSFSADVGNKVTNQFVSEFSTKLFNSSDPDPNGFKILLPGDIGPQTISWDANDGDMQIRKFCNVQPRFGELQYVAGGTNLPNAYDLALKAIKVPATDTNPDYDAVKKNYNDKLEKQTNFENLMNNEWKQYCAVQKDSDLPIAYKTWNEYVVGNPGKKAQYAALLAEVKVANEDLSNVQLATGSSSSIVQALNKWNKWYMATDAGSKGADSNWSTAGTDIKVLIGNWKAGKYTGGGSFTVSNSSSVYQKTVVEVGGSFWYDIFRFGGSGGGQSVFSESSTYSLTFNYKASARVNIVPPPVYNLDLIKQYRSNNISEEYKGNKPLTGTPDAPIQNLITSAIILFGLEMDAKLDETTYKALKEQSKASVSLFGLFGVGGSQSYESTKYNDDSASFKTTLDLQEPFIVGLTTETYS